MKIEFKQIPVQDIRYGTVVYIDNINNCNCIDSTKEKIYMILDAEVFLDVVECKDKDMVLVASLDSGTIIGVPSDTLALPLKSRLEIDVRDIL